MIELICIEPNPPKELQHLGRYECLDTRVTKEGEAQARVLSRAGGTPQVPHQLWWPVDFFQQVEPANREQLRAGMARIDAALAELQKLVG